MTRFLHKLSAVKVARLKAPGLYGDGGGLWLQVTSQGSWSWVFRFMRHGRARQMGLGPLHAVTLAEARDKARQCRKLLIADIDPIEARQARARTARAAPDHGQSFRQCAALYLKSHEPIATAMPWPSAGS